MTSINWDQTFPVDPSTGEILPRGTAGGVELPTYGNYGGGGYSSGKFGGQLLTTASGQPLSQSQLTKLGSHAEDPVDRLDYLFYRHDVVSSDVGDPYTRAQASADAALVKSLIKLDASYDPEASVYAGFTSFAMMGRLALHDQLDLLSPRVLVAVTQDAASDIQYGLEHLPPRELVAALDALFEPTSQAGGFAFTFEVTTTSLKQELVERIAVHALNHALDFGEADDAPLNTGFPVSGVSEYQITFNVFTHGLDFLSV
jgi:hypothetical protein